MRLFSKYRKLTDESLMELVQQNDYGAFEELHSRYAKRLLAFMSKMLQNDEERAQDLLQDLFVKLVEHPYKFDVSRKFQSWIFTVAANMCRNEYRGTKYVSGSTDDAEVLKMNLKIDGLVHELDGQIFTKHLNRLLDQLKYEHRETFVLRYQEDLSLNEIAETMECSLGTVKSRLFYTTKKLAEDLAGFRPLLKN